MWPKNTHLVLFNVFFCGGSVEWKLTLRVSLNNSNSALTKYNVLQLLIDFIGLNMSGLRTKMIQDRIQRIWKSAITTSHLRSNLAFHPVNSVFQNDHSLFLTWKRSSISKIRKKWVYFGNFNYKGWTWITQVLGSGDTWLCSPACNTSKINWLPNLNIHTRKCGHTMSLECETKVCYLQCYCHRSFQT